MATSRITAAITRNLEDTRPIKALLDPFNPEGSTPHVRFTTSRTQRWDTLVTRSLPDSLEGKMPGSRGHRVCRAS
jgi:type III restriction enzyme